MINFFSMLSPLVQVILGGTICLLFTICGALPILLFKRINANFLNFVNCFAFGIMLAATIFSLFIPALESCKNIFIVLLGIFLGILLIYIGNFLFDIFYKNNNSNIKESLLLLSSITIHNIPEGLAIGVAFGSLDLAIAINLMLGIALQNIPEGASVSFPLNQGGFSRYKSFIYGFLSGCVEPIAAIFGYVLISKVVTLLPFILSLSAGVMLYVVIFELISFNIEKSKVNFSIILVILGFSLMLFLENILV